MNRIKCNIVLIVAVVFVSCTLFGCGVGNGSTTDDTSKVAVHDIVISDNDDVTEVDVDTIADEDNSEVDDTSTDDESDEMYDESDLTDDDDDDEYDYGDLVEIPNTEDLDVSYNADTAPNDKRADACNKYINDFICAVINWSCICEDGNQILLKYDDNTNAIIYTEVAGTFYHYINALDEYTKSIFSFNDKVALKQFCAGYDFDDVSKEEKIEYVNNYIHDTKLYNVSNNEYTYLIGQDEYGYYDVRIVVEYIDKLDKVQMKLYELGY